MKRYSRLDVFLLLVVLGLSLFIMNAVLDELLPPYSTLEQVYRDYNHVRMFEDGSYIGEDINGNAVNGCIRGAICND